MALYGPDVFSGEPKDIFSRIKADFGIVKVSGNPPPYKWNYTNPNAAAQLKGAYRETGLVGAYHFTYGKASANTEADFFISELTKLGWLEEAVLFIDYEGPAIKKGRDWVKKFAQRIKKKTGKTPVIYASGSVIVEQELGSLGYPIWEASYPTNATVYGYNPPKGKVWYKDRLLWQYTGKGRLTGYGGNLDLNVFYGTKADWLKLANGGTPTPKKEKTMISNCGIDERGKSKGGQAGDQTGKEYRVKEWYDKPWLCVLRPATKEIGDTLAKIARQAANNDCIGYDQSQRLTYYEQLKKADWHPENIKTKCEADCSSSTAANVIATGHQLGIEKLQKVLKDSYTGNLRERLKAAGFTVLTSDKYTKSSAHLLPGDVLLNDNQHVAINLTKGSDADGEKYGPKKEQIEVDGWWGHDTTVASQKYLGTTADGIISGQAESDKKYLPRAVSGVWRFVYTKSGSDLIRALQKMCNMKEKDRDGHCGKKTVKTLQKYLDVKVTGKLDEATVKAWQRYLNGHKK